MNTRLFRKEALQKLAQPVSPDERVTLIAPGWWYTLAAVFVLLCLAAFWGWLGRIDTKVHGAGMLLETAGFHNVVSLGEGMVQHLTVGEGAEVDEGDVLAVIALPLQEMELAFLRQRFERIKEAEASLLAMTEENRTGRLGLFEKMRTDNVESVRNLEGVLETLSDLAQTYQSFRQQGFVTQIEALRILQDLVATSISFTRQQQDTLRMEIEKADFDLQFARELWRKQLFLLEAEHDLLSSIAAFGERSLIRSPARGIVAAIHKSSGDYIGIGEVLALLHPEEGEILHVRALIPAAGSKRVRVGQRVYIAPANVEPQRAGYIRGEVASVGRYPATFEQLLNIFKNADLARMLQGDSVAVPVEVNLIPDAANRTGVRWTGREPREVEISAGSICHVAIVVEQRPPVSYVLPWIREKLMGDVKREIGGRSP